ncbi:GNAT family N-acetyltransferase [Christensenellaceae bacterium NSJ-63]|uniref:GNAT family N-acetyltransferase n=1 Tax=Guopingia tenuis TaxID=2763656 RepID=A0A926HWT1_9FIRM|nr:GNAT family N-acetyltransferase [Guopingia tenuis]MBC8538355.1 GNAT family N-acetyltransferase [Guopingia tenuis]MBS5644514.1 GNAT family N-acetyltransferase [Clostridiales bacterium]
MAVEYFHVSESDYDLLEQIVELEQEVHAGRGGGMNIFEVHSFIRYGRVYAAMEYDEVLGVSYFMRDFDNPNRVFLYGILVKPSESGKHLGEALLANAFMDLKESNLRMVEVTVHPSNYKALRVYREELDFHVINVSDEDQMEEEEFLILRKTL